MKIFIAIDIGGTAIKYGVVDGSGKILFSGEIATEAKKGAAQILKKVEQLIKLMLAEYENIDGIGISTAGVVDTEEGIVLCANDNIPEYAGVRLKQLIESIFSIRTIVNNDVNAAALAEAWKGAGENLDSFFCMTLGTGIGGAIVINKKLYKGANYRAGEIGYLNKKIGQNMYYEKKASTSALIKMIREKSNEDRDISGQVVFERAKQGDIDIENSIDEWVDEICKGIQNIIYVLDPGVIIIGGGISLQKEYLLDKIKKQLKYYLPEGFERSTEIFMAQCGNEAGLIGAVYEFIED